MSSWAGSSHALVSVLTHCSVPKWLISGKVALVLRMQSSCGMTKQIKTSKAAFKKLDEAFVTRHVPGAPYCVGDRVTIISVVNTATKRNPSWRYYVAGAWLNEDALSPVDPLG